MMMKRILLFFTLLISCSVFTHSQIFVDAEGNVYNQSVSKKETQANQKPAKSSVNRSKFDSSKLEFGGSFGLQFGDYTVVNVSPQIGYRFSNYISAGAGMGYTYYYNNKGGFTSKEHFLGLNLYSNFYPTSFLIFSVRPEISRMWLNEEVNGVSYNDEKFVPSVVLGGGVRFGRVIAQVKYDVVQNTYSPYGNRLFYSVGFSF